MSRSSSSKDPDQELAPSFSSLKDRYERLAQQSSLSRPNSPDKSIRRTSWQPTSASNDPTDLLDKPGLPGRLAQSRSPSPRIPSPSKTDIAPEPVRATKPRPDTSTISITTTEPAPTWVKPPTSPDQHNIPLSVSAPQSRLQSPFGSDHSGSSSGDVKPPDPEQRPPLPRRVLSHEDTHTSNARQIAGPAPKPARPLSPKPDYSSSNQLSTSLRTGDELQQTKSRSPSPQRLDPRAAKLAEAHKTSSQFGPPPTHHTVASKRNPEQSTVSSSSIPPRAPPRPIYHPESPNPSTQAASFASPPKRAPVLPPIVQPKPTAPPSEKPAPTFLPPPKRNVSSTTSNAEGAQDTPEPQEGPDVIDDSDEEEMETESSPSRLSSDYPDSSMANRRPPTFRKGLPIEAPFSVDAKLCCVSGEYICVSSVSSSQVIAAKTGQTIWQFSHNDLKCTSTCFLPSVLRENNETDRLWLGFRDGQLWEMDIVQRRQVNRRTGAHSAPIIKLHTCLQSVWSLDESGRLCIWSSDQHGQFDLQGPFEVRRIGPKHSFSLVVGLQLWVGSGRQVQVYDPGSQSDQTFCLTQKGLSAPTIVSEIVAGCSIPGSDRVYFGHKDGKVSVYSQSKLSFVDSANISWYSIVSMAAVGQNLWIGYNTGVIYVYDPSVKPWKVLKTWKGHKSSLIDLKVAPASIFQIKRLQVISLHPERVRFWDGLMMDDWLEAEMRKRTNEFCTFRNCDVLICTWNAGACRPHDLSRTGGQYSDIVSSALQTCKSPSLVVFGFQELVDLENKKMTAKSLLTSKKKDSGHMQDLLTRQYKDWQEHLTKMLKHLRGNEYVHLKSSQLVGLFTCIFVKASEQSAVKNVDIATVKTGLGGFHGNKGAVIARFLLDDSSFCFVNCHLAAGQGHTTQRNNNAADILESASLESEKDEAIRNECYVYGGDGSMIFDHEICFLNGDLNYRIALSRDVAVDRIRRGELDRLLEQDQLVIERKKNPRFRLRSFQEAKITFDPTYKYNVGGSEYDTSGKRRVPAWCDRILYKAEDGRVNCRSYQRLEIKCSDHRPVSACYSVKVKTVLPAERAEVFKKVAKEWAETIQQASHLARVEYMVSVGSFDYEESLHALRLQQDNVPQAIKYLLRRK